MNFYREIIANHREKLCRSEKLIIIKNYNSDRTVVQILIKIQSLNLI